MELRSSTSVRTSLLCFSRSYRVLIASDSHAASPTDQDSQAREGGARTASKGEEEEEERAGPVPAAHRHSHLRRGCFTAFIARNKLTEDSTTTGGDGQDLRGFVGDIAEARRMEANEVELSPTQLFPCPNQPRSRKGATDSGAIAEEDGQICLRCRGAGRYSVCRVRWNALAFGADDDARAGHLWH